MLFPIKFKDIELIWLRGLTARVRKGSALGVLLVAASLLEACTTPTPEVSTGIASCPEPRPQICTTIYAPVCAVHSDGRTENHASACNACADDTVVDFSEGACEDTDS